MDSSLNVPLYFAYCLVNPPPCIVEKWITYTDKKEEKEEELIITLERGGGRRKGGGERGRKGTYWMFSLSTHMRKAGRLKGGIRQRKFINPDSTLLPLSS